MGLRLARLRRPSGSILMVPMDHGVSMGPLPGLADPAAALAAVAEHATCVTVHRGLVPHAVAAAAARGGRPGVLLHLSASTDAAPDPHDKRLVASVEDALRMGCDGVSVHVNVGAATEARQLEDVGRVAAACRAWGMPLLAMMYPRGPHVKDARDPDLVAHAARLGAELGADIVKVPFTSAATFGRVVAGATVPVVVAGGPARDLDAFLADMRAAADAGAAGISVGRNVFERPHALARLADLFP